MITCINVHLIYLVLFFVNPEFGFGYNRTIAVDQVDAYDVETMKREKKQETTNWPRLNL